MTGSFLTQNLSTGGMILPTFFYLQFHAIYCKKYFQITVKFKNLELLPKQKIIKDFNNPYLYFENSINNDLILKQAKNISKKKFFPFITPIKFKKFILKNIKKAIN